MTMVSVSTSVGGRTSSNASALRSSASWHSARARVAPGPRNMVNIEPDELHAPLEVEDAELGADVPVRHPLVLGAAVGSSPGPTTSTTGCPLAGAVGRVGRREVGDAQQQLAHSAAASSSASTVERLLGLAQRPALGLQRLGLVDLAVAAEATDLLRDRVDPRPQLVALGAELALPARRDAAPVELVEPSPSTPRRRRTARPAHGHVELGADPADVEHRAASVGEVPALPDYEDAPRAANPGRRDDAEVRDRGASARAGSVRSCVPRSRPGRPGRRGRRLTIRYGDTCAVDELSFRAEQRRGHGPARARTAPARPRRSRPSRATGARRRARSGCSGSTRGATTPRSSRHIGVMLQAGGVYTGIRPPEVLRLFASYYDDPADPDELLERVGLADRRRSTWRSLSGGEQQRLSLALALVGRPQVAFLDEPTAGIDPAGRQLIRRVIADLRADGVAVLLTTHDLDEAEKLADRVVIIDHGRLLADAARRRSS